MGDNVILVIILISFNCTDIYETPNGYIHSITYAVTIGLVSDSSRSLRFSLFANSPCLAITRSAISSIRSKIHNYEAIREQIDGYCS